MTLEAPNSPTKGAKRAIFVIIALFAFGYFRYKPYLENVWMIDDLSFASIFHLFFFVVNQSLAIIHESGHGVCYIAHCPEFLTALNGTLFQLLFPLGVGVAFYLKRQKLAAFVSFFFLGISLGYTAWYISTSYKGRILRAEESFLGVDGYHDFYFILDKINLLKYYHGISLLVNFVSIALILGSLAMIFIECFIKDDE